MNVRLAIYFGLMAAVPMAGAQERMADYSALPPLAAKVESTRSIMLTMSTDHQLFIKAYNDYSDLTGDGNPENTFTLAYNYFGYFDHTLCYTHDNTKFNPVARWGSTRRCAAGQWSGNFLNWATMTRIDLVRQVLYGGLRSTDTATATVLERSYLPQDAHSFAKYVPFNVTDLSGLAVVPASGSRCAAGSNTGSCAGYTFCNTTRVEVQATSDQGIFSQNVTEPPLLRVVKGNYMLWDSSERYQCLTTSADYQGRNYDANKTTETNSEAKTAFSSGLGSTNPNIAYDPAGANLNNSANSGIQAFARPPLFADVTDYIVRVSVCTSAYPPIDTDPSEEVEALSYECEKYGDNLKPAGLLQRYGAHPEKYNVRFGLLTGSYNSNKEYGALRKNIEDFSEEVNTDGTFSNIADVGNSIVRNLDALRIVDYRYQDPSEQYRGTYRSQDSRPGGETINGRNVACDWGKNSFENGQCRNWGNPFSELLTESYRYLTGAEDPSFIVPNESTLLSGLSIANWSLPTDGEREEQDEFSCSSKSVLGVNASAVSYDWSEDFAGKTPGGAADDDGLGIPDGDETKTLEQLTDALGITGNYFLGHNGGTGAADVDGQCSEKAVTSLGKARGTCPETPRLEGGYLGAGLAKYIYNSHQISTYGVSLTDAVPRINVPLTNDLRNGPKVVIVPACRNLGVSGNCALVAFKVIEDPVAAPASGVARAGSYFVSWEDTEQGGDYDVDAAGIIRYERKTNGDVVVETKLLYNGTPDILEFGYVISGTSNDGIKFPARTPGDWGNLSVLQRGNDASWTPTTAWCIAGNGCESLGGGTSQRVTFSAAAGSSVDFLPSPLQLAATNGSLIGAGGHAIVNNPGELKHQLDGILRFAANDPTPGTGASVATTALAGEGLVLSSLYAPEQTYDNDGTEEKITWAGQLNGLFYKDDYFWEDCNQAAGADAGVITDGDCVVRIYMDEDSKQTVFDRYSVVRDTQNRITGTTLIASALPYTELKPLWSAMAELSKVTDPLVQRTYGADGEGKQRYIFTALAQDNSDHVTGDDVMPFIPGNFAATTAADTGLGGRNYRLLDAGDADAAQEVVRYIRGDETLTGARKRTLNGKPWLLGDIIHSTAALVGRPAALYDAGRIGDVTYSAFTQRYRNRRLVTYVGGNDGMLHAFNGGFFNYNTDAPGYQLRPVGADAGDYTEYALGAELWAYVPYNLLPHLKWLKDPNYSHVYYVDAKVHTFDVNIFSGTQYSATDYPGGWGTILVVGMRFGGGEYALDSNGDGTEDRTLRSAYIIMDVTNPEKPPRLLGEITDEQMGFTIGDLDILSFRKPNAVTGSYANPARNEWYLVFGSGPTGATALDEATSDQAAQLFHLNLNLLTDTGEAANWLDKTSAGLSETDANSYIGGVTAVDWNSDFSTDMVYIGAVGTAVGGSRGGLLQAPVSYGVGGLDMGAPNRLLRGGVTPGTAGDLPFSRAPMVVREFRTDSYWVYAASGKLLVSDHLRTNNIGDNWIYGIRVNDRSEDADLPWMTTLGVNANDNNFKNVTNVTVTTDVNNGIRTYEVRDGATVTTPAQMEETIRTGYAGWRRNLKNRPELVFTAPAFVGTTFTVSSFSPAIADCQPGGLSRQYWLNLFTGLPQTDNQSLFIVGNNGVSKINVDSTGEGTVSEHMGAQGGVLLGSSKAGENILTVDSGGGLKSDEAGTDPPAPTRRAWREIPSDEIN